MRMAFFRKGFVEGAVVTVAILSVLLFVTWQLASDPDQTPADQLRSDVQFLTSELDTLKQRLDRSQAREAVLAREADVLRRANRLLREEETARQAELDSMQSELDFYRRLAGTGGTQSGLDVYRAELMTTASERVFQFVLTLTQNIRRASIISGHARIDVEGTLDDRPVTLYWSQLGGDEPEPTFRFKYFQQLEGYLSLPENFMPIRLVVTLEAEDTRSPVQHGYDWNALLSASGD